LPIIHDLCVFQFLMQRLIQQKKFLLHRVSITMSIA
jgi:hypothetical protein